MPVKRKYSHLFTAEKNISGIFLTAEKSACSLENVVKSLLGEYCQRQFKLYSIRINVLLCLHVFMKLFLSNVFYDHSKIQ